MDFTFTPEQDALREQARAFLAANPEPSWKELAELGWTGVSIAEEDGGAGLTFVEEAVLFEELGRALYHGPYFSTVALALPALPGRSPGRGRRRRLELDTCPRPPRLRPRHGRSGRDRRRGRDLRARGSRAGGAGLERRDAPARRRPRRRPRAPPCRVGRPGGDPKPHARSPRDRGVRRRTACARVCDRARVDARAVREEDRCLPGRLAPARRCVHPARARPLALALGSLVRRQESTEHGEQAPIAAAAAKASAAEAAVQVCETAIQVHGGIGFTWEHVLHRLYKRALWIESFGASSTTLRAEVAASLLDSAGQGSGFSQTPVSITQGG